VLFTYSSTSVLSVSFLSFLLCCVQFYWTFMLLLFNHCLIYNFYNKTEKVCPTNAIRRTEAFNICIEFHQECLSTFQEAEIMWRWIGVLLNRCALNTTWQNGFFGFFVHTLEVRIPNIGVCFVLLKLQTNQSSRPNFVIKSLLSECAWLKVQKVKFKK
jgi:hypothetical protein